MQIELVEHNPVSSLTGIGRYTRELYQCLLRRVSVRLTTSVDPPFAHRFSFLHNLPLGIQGHQPGNIVHFMQIMGCAQMLWHPVHPAVATIHDLGMLVWPEEARMFNALDRFLLRLSLLGLRRMDAMIAVSEFTRQAVCEQLRIPPDRVYVVYSGTNRQIFRPRPDARQWLEARYDVPDGAHYRNVLYVGSELPRKNLKTLLEALYLLRRNIPYVRLLKVGSPGSERFRAETKTVITELTLNESVFFFDTVPDQDLPYFYSAADIYVCPSFLEGFGFPVLEAMACGTPVVTSNTSSLPEVAGDAALLVDPYEAEAIAAAMRRVLEDPDLAADLRQRGLERARQFTWERTAHQILSVYRWVGGDLDVKHAAITDLEMTNGQR